jgi:tetratricopeptide (TPR) repeat protein
VSRPTIVVSYSHKDESWKDRVVTHLQGLDRQGLVDTWDDRRIEAGQEWEQKIEDALQAASLAVLLISADFLASRFITEVELPTLLQRHLRQGVRMIPLIVHPCDWQGHPWISRVQARPVDAQPLSGLDEIGVNQVLAALVAEISRILRQAGVRVGTPEFVPIPAEKISLGRLPDTGLLLVGREEPLARLDAAWERDTTHVLTVVAPGGVGKTALVNTWLAHVEMDHHRGAMRVFDWSFYSQGSSDVKSATGEPFIHEALRWFGDPDPTEGSPWQKGERLANLIRKERTLLILDGLEPLQEPPRAGVVPGSLKDPGVEALLKNLASANPGLCIVTTREPVEALAPRLGRTVETIDLRELEPVAGSALLREYGVQGPEKELKEVSKEFGGHALALTLLATYLRDVCDGDVRRWKEVPLLEEDAEKGGHAFRVMRSYENWLGRGPELEILYLLGLFDRPANTGEIAALVEEPAILGLTEKLVAGGEATWKRAVARLRKARLVAGEGGLGEDGGLDAHPLVRTYFGQRLEREHSEAFRAGHLRLYEYLTQVTPYQPETLEEMQPLFHAVIHGCRGGRVQDALDEVFESRVRRENEHYSIHKLGAFSSDLAALSGFFAEPWVRPAPGLKDADKGFVLAAAGFDLRAQGRLADALAPLRSSQSQYEKEGDWRRAAMITSNLSELRLTLGQVDEAVVSARESVKLTDRSGDPLLRMRFRTTLADALHQAGRLEEARALFEDAEAIQAEQEPQYPFLYSLPGYRYCDLLLGQSGDVPPNAPSRRRRPGRDETTLPTSEILKEGRSRINREEGGQGWEREGMEAATSRSWGLRDRVQRAERLELIRQRAKNALKLAGNYDLPLLTKALDHLTLGHTHLHLALASRSSRSDPTHLHLANEHFDEALNGLRTAGQSQEIPRGLLARAALWRVTEEPDKATADLGEVFEIAERDGMRLHLTDAHLERARLRVDQGEIDAAREDVEAARRLVEETGYHRRDPEVAELEAIVGAGDGHRLLD